VGTCNAYGSVKISQGSQSCQQAVRALTIFPSWKVCHTDSCRRMSTKGTGSPPDPSSFQTFGEAFFPCLSLLLTGSDPGPCSATPRYSPTLPNFVQNGFWDPTKPRAGLLMRLSWLLDSGEDMLLPRREDGNSPPGHVRRTCPGQHLAEPSVFLSIATSLATFNISKAFDEQGNVIEPDIEWLPGTIR
jgi:hypothetical protein